MYMNAPSQEVVSASTGITVLEILVKNHPGVMAHVCSLFSRRAYNLEGIAVLPIGDGTLSRIWLKVAAENRLDQVVKQLEKLQDVRRVERHGSSHPVFTGMAVHFEV